MADVSYIVPSLPRQVGVKYKLIPNVLGYAVGSDGTVWTCRNRGPSHGTFYTQWRRLKLTRNNHGKFRVTLYRGVGQVPLQRHVHRLVAVAFCPCPEHCMHVCHRDDDSSNNTVANLYWGTPLTNRADSKRNGGWAHGETHGCAKLSNEQAKQLIRDCRKLPRGSSSRIKRGSLQPLMLKYGLSRSYVSAVAAGRTWKHLQDIE